MSLELLFTRIFKPLLVKSILKPTLYELYSSAAISTTDAIQILKNTEIINNNEFNLLYYNAEFEILKKELNKRYNKTNLNYPKTFGFSNEASRLIFLLIRTLCPKKILETGVANGVSSYFILNALNLNNAGMLYSIDINENVGQLLNIQEKQRWKLLIIRNNDKKSFKNTLDKLSNFDFFIHDSNHSYEFQMLEYSSIYPKIKKGGILSSDDIDNSYAFLTFCHIQGIKPSILVTPSKVFGFIIKNH